MSTCFCAKKHFRRAAETIRFIVVPQRLSFAAPWQNWDDSTEVNLECFKTRWWKLFWFYPDILSNKGYISNSLINISLQFRSKLWRFWFHCWKRNKTHIRQLVSRPPLNASLYWHKDLCAIIFLSSTCEFWQTQILTVHYKSRRVL